MSPWKSSLAVLLFAAAAFGQMAGKQAQEVTRVGLRIACQCGSCQDTVSGCKMQMCGFSAPARANIARKQSAGISDQAIIAEYVNEYGNKIMRQMPSPAAWIIPYVALAAGIAVIYWFIRRSYHPKPAVSLAGGVSEDPKLARYHAQIEKDLADLD